MTRAKYLLFIFCFIWSSGFCQQTGLVVDGSYNDLEWPNFVNKIEQNHPIRIFYKEADVADFQAVQLSTEVPLIEFLQTQLPGCKIVYDQKGHIFISKEIEIVTELSKSIYPEVVITSDNNNPLPLENKDFASTTNEHIAKPHYYW